MAIRYLLTSGLGRQRPDRGSAALLSITSAVPSIAVVELLQASSRESTAAVGHLQTI